MTEPAGPAEKLDSRRLLLQSLGGALVLFLVLAAGALWFRPQLQHAGVWFVDTFGLGGAALGVFAADSFGVPIPPDTYLAAAVTAGTPPVITLTALSIASITGGQVAFWLGTKLDRWAWTRRRLDLFRRRAGPWFARWGTWTVVVAAWTPLPFSVVSTLAGAYRMPYRPFALSTLHRAPRMVVYYLILSLGWTAGTRLRSQSPLRPHHGPMSQLQESDEDSSLGGVHAVSANSPSSNPK